MSPRRSSSLPAAQSAGPPLSPALCILALSQDLPLPLPRRQPGVAAAGAPRGGPPRPAPGRAAAAAAGVSQSLDSAPAQQSHFFLKNPRGPRGHSCSCHQYDLDLGLGRRVCPPSCPGRLTPQPEFTWQLGEAWVPASPTRALAAGGSVPRRWRRRGQRMSGKQEDWGRPAFRNWGEEVEKETTQVTGSPGRSIRRAATGSGLHRRREGAGAGWR